MARNLDATLAASLPSGVVGPVVLAAITLKSGVEYVWTGVGNLLWNGQTFKGLGEFASMGPIGEGSAVKADGTTITLRGIGNSSIAFPPPGITVPDPPFPPPAGQSVTWAWPTIGGAGWQSAAVDFSSSVGGSTGFADGTGPGIGSLFISRSRPLSQTEWDSTWGGFVLPVQIPAGTEIVGVWGVVECVATGGCAFNVLMNGSNSLVGSFGALNGTFYSNHADVLPATITATVGNSLFQDVVTQSVNVGFVGLAVYYKGVPQNQTSMMHEALNDIQLGAPVKIWYGHWLNGALLGTPYLIFAGTVDKPTVDISDTSSIITLALENRLVNLQRPNQRRYTAADQRLLYPTDTGFNWVEILNDIALRWGN